MCRGFGILANFEEVRYELGNSSHSSIGRDIDIDNFIKLEILMDTSLKRGYRVEIDGSIDGYTTELWTDKQFLLDNKLNPKLKKFVMKWCKENEFVIFK